MESPDNNSGGNSQDIRELNRQIRKRMEEQGYPEEDIDFLMNYQSYKAGIYQYIKAHDTMIEKMEQYRADYIFPKFEFMKGYTREERLALSHELSKMPEMNLLRLFSSDEPAALKAQMSVTERTVFVTEKKGRVVWKK
jgi:hypothetical protein